MSGRYGSSPHELAANRLLRARIAAGYTCGVGGAGALGLDVGRYGMDEGGRKPIPEDRAVQYASAFGVFARWITEGWLPSREDRSDVALRTRLVDALPLDDVSAVFIGLDGPSMSLAGAGARLSEARRAAGIATAREAAERFGWSKGTYAGHEIPRGRLTSVACRTYGYAFGVSAEWLLLGDRHPQGMSPTGGDLPLSFDVQAFTRKARADMESYRAEMRPLPRNAALDGVSAPALREPAPGMAAGMDDDTLGGLARVAEIMDGAGDVLAASRIRRGMDEIERLRGALAPFSEFARWNVDVHGWLKPPMTERIADWFGPSEFLKAREACPGKPGEWAPARGAPVAGSGPAWKPPVLSEPTADELGYFWQDTWDDGTSWDLRRKADLSLVGVACLVERGDPPREVASWHCKASDRKGIVEDRPTPAECLEVARAMLLADAAERAVYDASLERSAGR